MSLASIKAKQEQCLNDIYASLENKGAAMPEKKNLVNVAPTIDNLTVKPTYKIMTVQIDMTNSNPETSCTYADDAVDMTPGSEEWDDFFGCYPVLLKNGVELGKLNPNNFEQFEDGSTSDITSGESRRRNGSFPD